MSSCKYDDMQENNRQERYRLGLDFPILILFHARTAFGLFASTERSSR